MRISQRGTSFAAVATATYTLDRWKYVKSGAMVHTITQDTDVPTLSESGYLFQNSLRLNLTTPDTAIAAGDFALVQQPIEGFNWTNLAQKYFVISFWVKATATGIYTIGLQNSGVDRAYVGEYTINTTNTWEYKSVLVSPSPSAGTWNYTNGVGLYVQWVLAAGTTFQTTAGAWQTGDFFSSANQVNGVNTGATDFRVTGVMINEGIVAAPFKLFGESIGGELEACQRYYEKSYELTTTPGTNTSTNRLLSVGILTNSTTGDLAWATFLTPKRTAPTMLFWTTSGTLGSWQWIGAGGFSQTAAIAVEAATHGFSIETTGLSGATSGQPVSGTGHYEAGCEL